MDFPLGKNQFYNAQEFPLEVHAFWQSRGRADVCRLGPVCDSSRKPFGEVRGPFRAWDLFSFLYRNLRSVLRFENRYP